MGSGKVAVLWTTLWTAALLVNALLPKWVLATHEVDHRFIVYGYVRDDRGGPVKDQKVIVVDTRLDQGMTTFTDRDGYYEALLHLHNEDLGDEIVVMAGEQKKSIRATFNPEDKHTERRTQVDFGAAAAASPSSPLGKYGWAVLVAAGVAVTIGALRYRRWTKKQPSKGSKKSK
jgi:hypothetical protein